MRLSVFAALLMVGAVPAIAQDGAGHEGHADPAPKAEAAEASIPFVNQGGVSDWRADGSKGIYIRASGGDWYYARFLSPCHDLPFAEAVGFEAKGTNRLDKFSSVIVRGDQCRFTSLVKSAAPKGKKAKKGKVEAPKS